MLHWLQPQRREGPPCSSSSISCGGLTSSITGTAHSTDHLREALLLLLLSLLVAVRLGLLSPLCVCLLYGVLQPHALNGEPNDLRCILQWHSGAVAQCSE